MSCIIRSEYDYINFSIDYLIRIICLLSRVLYNSISPKIASTPYNSIVVRHSSYWDRSLQNGLGDEQTCGTTLASAYVLCHLSAAWSQLQMKERES